MGNFDPDQFWSKKKRMLEEPGLTMPVEGGPKRTPSVPDYDYKDRGGCLTAYLVVITIGSVIGLCLNLAFGSVSIFPLVISVVDLVGIAGLWYWQRWAYYTLAAGYGLTVVLACSYSDRVLFVGFTIGAVLGLVTLWLAFDDKMAYLK